MDSYFNPLSFEVAEILPTWKCEAVLIMKLWAKLSFHHTVFTACLSDEYEDALKKQSYKFSLEKVVTVSEGCQNS